MIFLKKQRGIIGWLTFPAQGEKKLSSFFTKTNLALNNDVTKRVAE